jgi:5-methyltetrahydrofolate--homocysteine methyltransferase
MASTLFERAQKRIVLLDGGMGTELIKRGFQPGACPESWNVDRPDVVKGIYRSYYEAGADAVTTNSFGGTPIKLAAFGQADRCYEFNRAAAELACAVRPPEKFVAGSIGPTGKFLQPQGEFTPEQFEAAFAEQAQGLAEGGVDMFLLETHYDLEEAASALRGVRTVSDRPVGVTLTFNKTPRGFFTMMGNSIPQFIQRFKPPQVQAVGANCTLDSKAMADVAREFRSVTSLPVIIQANAGQPLISPDGTVHYSQPLDEYVKYIPAIIRNGARIVGGCCGTDPDYIRAMAAVLANL